MPWKLRGGGINGKLVEALKYADVLSQSNPEVAAA